MKKNAWLLLFVTVLALHLSGILLLNDTLQWISKPLLVPLLIVYFLVSIKGMSTRTGAWIMPALFFSWLGDVLLMFQERDPLFFLLGLAAFLLAHICYIVFFHGLKRREAIAGKVILLALVVIYYAALLSFLSAYLGVMKLPVRIYGIVISFMFLLALHMIFLENKAAGRLMLAGALLFVVSDSMLAIDKFYARFEMAGFLIISYYVHVRVSPVIHYRRSNSLYYRIKAINLSPGLEVIGVGDRSGQRRLSAVCLN